MIFSFFFNIITVRVLLLIQIIFFNFLPYPISVVTLKFLKILPSNERIDSKYTQLLERLFALASYHHPVPLWISEDGEQVSDSFMTGTTGIYSTLMSRELKISPFLS